MRYKLYPLQFEYVDWKVYYSIKMFMSVFFSKMGRKPLDDDEYERNNIIVSDRLKCRFGSKWRNSNDRSDSFYLIFPNEDLSVSYEYDALCQEVIILWHSSERLCQNGYIDEDECTYDEKNEYFYYVVSENRLVLRHEIGDWEWRNPQILNCKKTFIEAMTVLLHFMRDKNLQEELWYVRLNDSLSMLQKDNVNEMHILHNSGLYDMDGLWAMFHEKGIDHEQMQHIRIAFIQELRRYAMYVINMINWVNGGLRSDISSGLLTDEMNERFMEEASRRSVYPNQGQKARIDISQHYSSTSSPTISNSRLAELQREEKNKIIFKGVVVFLVIAILVLLLSWAIQYYQAGVIKVIGGGVGVLGLSILRNVPRLMSGYEYRWSLRKRMTVVMSILFGIIACLALVPTCAYNAGPSDDSEIYEDTVVLYSDSL